MDKPGFCGNFKVPRTFADPSYFKTVFISGDNMVQEMHQAKLKEIEDWKNKVVVESTHFTVNTRQPHVIA